MDDNVERSDCTALFKSARDAYDKGDLKEAHRLFNEVIERFPDTHEAQYAAAYIGNINSSEDAGEPLKELALKFNGSASEYFRVWIVNLCMSLLTLGIYSAWAKVRRKRYMYSNVSLDGTSFQYLGQPIPILKGRAVAAVLFSGYYASMNIFTFAYPYVLAAGLVIAPWVIVNSAAFNARYSAYRNMTFHFGGTYWDAVKAVYVCGLVPLLVLSATFNIPILSSLVGGLLIIFGLTFPWLLRRLKNFIVTGTSFGGRHGEFSATGGEFFKIYLVGALIVILVGVLSFVPGVIMVLKSSSQYMFIVMLVIIYSGYVISFAYIQARTTNLIWNSTRLGPIRFYCTLRTRDLVLLYLTNAICIIATAGLLIPWAVIRVAKYRVGRTRVFSAGVLAEFQAGDRTAVKAAGAELGDFFDMDLSI